jgi:hypothetical protein
MEHGGDRKSGKYQAANLPVVPVSQPEAAKMMLDL